MSKNNILTKLKDDNEYYYGVGKKYISNSDIGTLLHNPKEFGKSKEDNINFAKGRIFHQHILEEDKLKDWKTIDVASRNTKAYKEFIKDNDMPFAVLQKEFEEMIELAEHMLSDFTFYSMIRSAKAEYEVPQVTKLYGLDWKGKADIVTNDCVIDLKTTQNINKFAKWSAYDYNYDSQAYIYETLFGKPMVFYVVCKTTGQVGIFECSKKFLENGEKKVERAVEVYNKYFQKNAPEDINNYIIRDVL